MIPHPLVLAIGFFTMVGITQGGVTVQTQLQLQNKSETAQHTKIVDISKLASTASEPPPDPQTSSIIVRPEMLSPWFPYW
jgi:hypothetical protein